MEVEESRIKTVIAYIEKNRVELHLLLNLSAGSSLETFPEKIVEGYAGNCLRFLKHIKKQNQKLAFKDPSDFFFKSVARFALRATAEVVRGRTSQKEMEKIAREIIRYNFYGFRGLAEVTTTSAKQGEVK